MLVTKMEPSHTHSIIWTQAQSPLSVRGAWFGMSEEEGAFVFPWNRRDGRWCGWLSGFVLVVCQARSVGKVILESSLSFMEDTMHGIPCWMTSERESGAGTDRCLENLQGCPMKTKNHRQPTDGSQKHRI